MVNTPAAARPWVERLARTGYAAKGIVYILIGVLAAAAAFHLGGTTTGSRGALRTVHHGPMGTALLALLAAGLAAYSVWCLVEAVTDPDRRGTSVKGLAIRAGRAGTGVIYAGLTVSAVHLLLGQYGGSDNGGAETWTARLLAVPLGTWLVGAVGLGIVGYAVSRLRHAAASNVCRELGLEELDLDEYRWVVRVGRFGHAARAVVFALIGVFVMRAAWSSNPQAAGGLADVLATLRRQPSSTPLLGTVALGLASYGCFELIKARYRRM